eukprot:6170189-Karenia_brevis.AAC.1
MPVQESLLPDPGRQCQWKVASEPCCGRCAAGEGTSARVYRARSAVDNSPSGPSLLCTSWSNQLGTRRSLAGFMTGHVQ